MTQKRPYRAIPLFLSLLACVGGCGDQASSAGSGGSANDQPASTQSLGPPRLQAQEGWVEQVPKSAMRLLEYRLEGEGEPVLVVSHWPNGVGGLKANLDRWRSSVEGPDVCEVVTTQPNGLRIDLLGGHGMVSDGMGGASIDGALMAAYVESPDGRFPGVYTVKVIGPASTLDAHRGRLEAFLAQL